MGASVAGWPVHSMGWRACLRPRPPLLRSEHTYVRIVGGSSGGRMGNLSYSPPGSSKRYESCLVLTPQAGTLFLVAWFVQTGRSGAPALGTLYSSLERSQVCMLTLPHFNVTMYLFQVLWLYHPIILSLNFTKDASGRGLVKMSAI